ncbi:MAG: HD family phosphohydrolase [Anaerolineae bacterium]
MSAAARNNGGRVREQEGSADSRSWVNLFTSGLLGLALIAGVSVILALPLLSRGVNLEIGEVSPRTIRAPRQVTYDSEIRTERARQQAASAVSRVYEPADPKVTQQQIRRLASVLDYISTIRYDPYGSLEQKTLWISQVPELQLPADVVSDTMALDDQSWQVVSTHSLAVLSQVLRQPIREGLDVIEVRRRIPNAVDPNLPETEAAIVSALAASFIKPNSLYNEERTESERAAAREAVPIQTHSYEKDEVIIREGERVKIEQLEALQKMGLLKQQVGWDDIGGVVLLVVILAVVAGLYLRRLSLDLWTNQRRLILLVVVTLAFAVAAEFMVPGHTPVAYLFPVAGAAMLLSALAGPQFSLSVTFLLSIAAGFLGGASLELTIYALIGGIVAALSIWRVERLNAFLWAGLYVALANIAVVTAFEFQGIDPSARSLMIQAGLAVANAGLSTTLAIAGFYALGALFGITTSLQLMELARPTHPLLHQLQLKAPGTYHHSLLVGNLAERAAQRVDADALLVRVGAYYHDIGKMLRPYFFVENQVEGANVHDRLDPDTSAQIIISHVTDGLELADEYGLPAVLRDFIAQHHGTTCVTYFYRQACDERGKDTVNEQAFRYPGPPPQTPEAAILMLADGVEATARANRPATKSEIDELVRGTINRALTEGQLDACDLTLRDLDQIRDAFVRILKGIYHPRIKYPEETRPASATTEREAAVEV